MILDMIMFGKEPTKSKFPFESGVQVFHLARVISMGQTSYLDMINKYHNALHLFNCQEIRTLN